MTTRTAIKVVRRAILIIPAEQPYKAPTLDRAVAKFCRAIARARKAKRK